MRTLSVTTKGVIALAVFASLLLGILLVTRKAPQHVAARGEGVLSIEETIALTREFGDVQSSAQERAEHRRRWERANPAALPRLYDILHDANQKRFWCNTLSLIGELGGEKDVGELVEFVKSYQGELGPADDTRLLLAFRALSRMSQREVPGARGNLHHMLVPEYWETVRFTVGGRGASATGGFQAYVVALVLHGCVEAADPEFPQIAREAPTRFQGQAREHLDTTVRDLLSVYEERKQGSKRSLR